MTILCHHDDQHHVCNITLNRPDAYNALSKELMNRLLSTLTTLPKTCRAVTITGAGKGFCAGHDLRELKALETLSARKDIFGLCANLMCTLQNIPQPVIAIVHGTAAAAGCQLAASCDLTIASDTARFATAGITIGLFCSTPMVALSRAVPAKIALDMLLSGRALSAHEAMLSGLVSRIAPARDLLAEGLRVAHTIASHPPHIVARGKNAFYRQMALNAPDAYQLTTDIMAENLGLDDAQSGIARFLGRSL